MSKIFGVGIVLGVLFCLVLLQMAFRAKRPVQYALGGIAMGLCAFLAVNLTGIWFTGVTLPVSILTLGVSAAGGLPGVTSLLLLQCFFVP